MVKIRKMSLSLLCLFVLSALIVTSASAETNDEYYGYEVLSKTVKTIVNENGEVTISEMELKGNKEDLKELIEKLNNDGRDIKAAPESGEISPRLGLGEGNYTGHFCAYENDTNTCNYPDLNFSFRGGGFLGADIKGNIISVISRATGASHVTDMKTQPRLNVYGYGLTSGDTILVSTHEFKSQNVTDFLTWDVNVHIPGVLAYVDFQAGADYFYKYKNNTMEKTYWATLTKR